MAAVASPAPQLYENGFSPLLARYANAPEAPASTAHAAHVAAIAPITTYIAQAPYVAAYPAVSFISSKKTFTTKNPFFFLLKLLI